MAAPRRVSNRVSNRSLTVPSPSSTCSGSSSGKPIRGPSQKYNHLIGEQKFVVFSAQESLKQALKIVERASSKEEKESALLQVKENISHCEELIMKLKVVLYVKNELDEIQLEMSAKRKGKESPTRLYARQKWLEGRLEKLLLKRRGRPGARGTRLTGSQSLGRRVGGASSLTGRGLRGRGGARHNETITLSSSHKRSSTIGSLSDITTPGEGGRGGGRSSSHRTSSSSRGEGGEDEEWYSTDSDDDEEDEADPDVEEEWRREGEREEEEEGKERQQQGLFEVQRSPSIFGPHSWNLLLLANYSNLLDETKVPDFVTSQLSEKKLNIKSSQAGLGTLWNDITKLQDLILTVTRSLSFGDKRKTLPSFEGKRGGDDTSFAKTLQEQTLVDEERPKQSWSRRIYGKEAKLYPQHQSQQLPQRRPVGPAAKHKPASKKIGNSVADHVTGKKAARPATRQGVELPVELEDYKQKCIEELMSDLTSTKLVDRRIDLVQLLGDLGCHGDPSIIKCLSACLTTDGDAAVQYESLKALIKHGAWDGTVIYAVTELLAKGSDEIQHDILSLITYEMNNNSLTLQPSSLDKSIIKPFFEVLNHILEDKKDTQRINSDISFMSAVVLSYNDCTVALTSCKERLQLAFRDGTEKQQSMALDILIKCSPDKELLEIAQKQSKSLINWKYRLKAVECLKTAGVQKYYEEADLVQYLLNGLTNEPVHVVKVAFADLARELGLKGKCETEIMKKIESNTETERVEGVTSLGGFVSFDNKTHNILMDIIELDPSTYVRLTAVSILNKATSLNTVIMARLMSRCEGAGPVARQCRHVLKRFSSSMKT